MDDIDKLKANDIATFSEGVEILKLELAEDDQARSKYGTDQWARPPSKDAASKLFAQIDEIEGYLKSAQSSDELVKEKIKGCGDLLKLLGGTDRELEEYVPSSRRAALTAKVEREAGTLRACLDEVGRLENRLRRKIQTVKEKAKADDISKSCTWYIQTRGS
jgi:programmed cell death 6-interacting protein